MALQGEGGKLIADIQKDEPEQVNHPSTIIAIPPASNV